MSGTTAKADGPSANAEMKGATEEVGSPAAIRAGGT